MEKHTWRIRGDCTDELKKYAKENGLSKIPFFRGFYSKGALIKYGIECWSEDNEKTYLIKTQVRLYALTDKSAKQPFTLLEKFLGASDIMLKQCHQ